MILAIENTWKHPKSHIPRQGSGDESKTFFVAVDATEQRWAAWPISEGKVAVPLCREDTFKTRRGHKQVACRVCTFEQGTKMCAVAGGMGYWE